jgi:hypothetical protein
VLYLAGTDAPQRHRGACWPASSRAWRGRSARNGAGPPIRGTLSGREADPMQWEYSWCRIEDDGPSACVANIDGQKLGAKPRLALTEYLNRLGADGWELVGVGGQHADVLYLKRPKPDGGVRVSACW